MKLLKRYQEEALAKLMLKVDLVLKKSAAQTNRGI